MRFSKVYLLTMLCGLVLCSACQNNPFQSPAPPPPPGISDVPAVRLNFRYEADLPAPDQPNPLNQEERNEAVQADFDAGRIEEFLDRTVTSPDKKHVLAVYHRITDVPYEYRLDMYAADGTVLRKMTSDTMAVHFPETIVWSPDSLSLAFVAMVRTGRPDLNISPAASPSPGKAIANTESNSIANANTSDPASNTEPEIVTTPSAPTPPAPTGILTFRTKQIYISSADGSGVRPLTENEGLIYFYYAWSPDSTMLAALATTAREWKYLEIVADSKKEQMVPVGRPRVIEKNGRERRLDDNLTAVHPVWSPDSLKVSAAFDTQIRIYDAIGTNPTQAAIPLRNQLLISSQAYDRNQQRQAQDTIAESNGEANTTRPPDQPPSMLPDEKLLVSYNPIVELAWTAEDLLYLKTAYIKRMSNEAESVMSFSRWHRIVLSPQVVAPVR